MTAMAPPQPNITAASSSSARRARGAKLLVRCEDVWKQYYFHAHRPRKLRDLVLQTLRLAPVAPAKPTWSLQAFNLELRPGETIGVIGHNGAGKSTLLKLLSRIHPPTRGTIEMHGRLGSIIELGAGFHEDLPGRENVYLAASFLGLRRREVDAMYSRIVNFAELGEHMETPVKYFSSGMRARLGFSIAINIDPDVLLIDEVLAVGDQDFQPKCKDAIRRLQNEGKGIILVSHDMDAIRSLCTQVIWLKHGAEMARGDPAATVDAYLEHYWPGCTRKAEASS